MSVSRVTIRFLVQIPKREIVFLHGLLEAYESLAVVRTVDPSQGIVELLASPSFVADVEELLDHLAGDIPLRILKSAPTLFLGD